MNKCDFCGKEFKKLSTFSVHQCEPRRRRDQEFDRGVQLGLQTFHEFFKSMQVSYKPKSYAEFMQSPYYSAFVKFGQFMVSVNAVNPPAFIKWIIASKIAVDKWTSDANYDKYLYQYLRTESVEEAVERSIKETGKWAEQNNAQFNHFFKFANANKVCQLINNGRISPWVIFNCASGVAFLESLDRSQLEMVYSIVEPEFWTKRFAERTADVEWAKQVLEAADL